MDSTIGKEASRIEVSFLTKVHILHHDVHSTNLNISPLHPIVTNLILVRQSLAFNTSYPKVCYKLNTWSTFDTCMWLATLLPNLSLTGMGNSRWSHHFVSSHLPVLKDSTHQFWSPCHHHSLNQGWSLSPDQYSQSRVVTQYSQSRVVT